MSQPSFFGRLRNVIKWWHLAIAAIVATASMAVYVIHWIAENRKCQELTNIARGYCREDRFEDCIEYLEKAMPHCCADRAIRVQLLEAKTFKLAVDYDQVTLIRNMHELTDLDREWRELREVRQNAPEILAAQGILEELHDRPTAAATFYQRAINADPHRNYANVHNYWGYTIFKWNLGGANWADYALNEFNEAIKINENYAWPHLNTGAVRLIQGDFNRAEQSLKKAEELLPDNPRVHLVWGTYWGKRAEGLRKQHLPQADQLFYEAEKHYKMALDKNSNLVDARYLLGFVYEKLGRNEDALYEYKKATSADGFNIQACLGLAQFLGNHGSKAEGASERARCIHLTSQLRSNFSARIKETSDVAAMEWLSGKLKEYESIEQNLRAEK
jgi:tetratricopeptide (TPR) repeat protein